MNEFNLKNRDMFNQNNLILRETNLVLVIEAINPLSSSIVRPNTLFISFTWPSQQRSNNIPKYAAQLSRNDSLQHTFTVCHSDKAGLPHDQL